MPTNEQIAKLPAWARQHIKELEIKPQMLIGEAARSRKKIEQLEEHNQKLQARVDAMVEMFQCAAKGENEIAKAIERIVQDWLVTEEQN